MANQVEITPALILDMLAQGKSREEIRVELGVSKTDIKAIFTHPELKGRKTKKKPGFIWKTASSVEEDCADMQDVENSVEEIPEVEATVEEIPEEIDGEPDLTPAPAESSSENEAPAIPSWNN